MILAARDSSKEGPLGCDGPLFFMAEISNLGTLGIGMPGSENST